QNARKAWPRAARIVGTSAVSQTGISSTSRRHDANRQQAGHDQNQPATDCHPVAKGPNVKRDGSAHEINGRHLRTAARPAEATGIQSSAARVATRLPATVATF